MNYKKTQTENNVVSPQSKNPYTVWFVVIAFVAPVVLAYVMYFFVEVKSFVNHGEILSPIVHIKTFQLKDETGKLIAEKKLTYKWRIISFVGRDCNKACQKRLYDMRQIHTSLGKNQHRLSRMLVHLQTASPAFQAFIHQQYPNAIHVFSNSKDITKALGKNAQEGIGINNNEAYIMDPMGNVMMRFTQDQPNKEFLYDLKKLLKASQIG